MYNKHDLSNIKKDIEKNIGHEILLETNKGRYKASKNKGVIKNAYPNIFTIEMVEEKQPRQLSFSYADILTSSIEITLLHC